MTESFIKTLGMLSSLGMLGLPTPTFSRPENKRYCSLPSCRKEYKHSGDCCSKECHSELKKINKKS